MRELFMKKMLKYTGFGLIMIIIILFGLGIYVKTMLPNVGEPKDLKIEKTSDKIDRGRYLANHVMVCIDCHSTRDWTSFSGPVVPGTEGKGGEVFDQNQGFPGKYIAPNITPFNLKEWTDGEIFRAITSGVSKDGRALFSIMPHHLYGQLDPMDIESVIVYLRSLKPIDNETGVSVSDFPMNFIINTIPQKPAFSKIPEQQDKINYGKYLITAAGCIDCHTKQDKGRFVGEPYAGGFEFRNNNGSIVRSANLTPDKTTGLGAWTIDEFVNRFKIYSDSSYAVQKSNMTDYQTVMPWTRYAGMSATDLEAIFVYLQSLPPINNRVETFVAAK